MGWTLNIVQNLILGLESTVSAPGGAHFGFQDLWFFILALVYVGEEHSWFWGISLVLTLFVRDISFKCPQLMISQKYHIWPQPKCGLCQLRCFIYIISKPNLYFSISLCRGRAFLVLRHFFGLNPICQGHILQMPLTHEISKISYLTTTQVWPLST